MPSGDEPVFLVPGQGADARGVLHEPYWASDVVRSVADDVLAVVQQVLAEEWPGKPPPLREVLLDPAQTVHMGLGVPQIAGYVVSVVTAGALVASGVEPVAVVGQSFGEIAALVCAGSLDVADGARAVCALNSAFESVRGQGAMALLPGVGERECRELLAGIGLPDLVLACVNSPEQTVVSGSSESVTALATVPELKVVRLPVPYASHHPGLGGVAARFFEGLRAVTVQPPRVPVYSPVAGRRYTPEDDLRQALADCVTKPVDLPPLVRELAAPQRLFVELGAGDTLTRAVRATVPAARAVALLGSDPTWFLDMTNEPARQAIPNCKSSAERSAMMSTLTVDGLRGVMVACLGGSGTVDLEITDLKTRSFEDLDFDSLARVELLHRLRESFGIEISDEDFQGFSGPRDLLDHVNAVERA
ncbi:hypothetical protein DMH01_32600 [Amycolatopsis sp. WAC 04182]|uniref:acyltransferase domain-containing protein n=1 Tax=Amycolatopsis sp. WAC 04182 TaxID=2203198 RepID=UPI000F793395|nr:acyltransferase domain-containing protein [Amycolatopsis sp. WAC 04182]RSN55081.1 hypothetical protein DMH01_32600 [Amycolatopsis sp. WAC 04182]